MKIYEKINQAERVLNLIKKSIRTYKKTKAFVPLF